MIVEDLSWTEPEGEDFNPEPVPMPFVFEDHFSNIRTTTPEDAEEAEPAVITKNAAYCNLCNGHIESTHRHDFQSCECGNLFVDGGKDYVRIGFTHEKAEDGSPAFDIRTEYSDGR